MVFNVWQAMSHSVFIHLVLKFKFCPERRKIIVSVKFSLKNPKIYKECMSSLKFCYQFFVYLKAYLALWIKQELTLSRTPQEPLHPLFNLKKKVISLSVNDALHVKVFIWAECMSKTNVK